MLDSVVVTATVIIAIFAVVSGIVTIFQHVHSQKIARANYMVALHDKRMEVYNAIDEYLGIFARDGAPEMKAVYLLLSKLRSAQFIFPEEVLGVVNELYHETSEYDYYCKKLESLQKYKITSSLSSDEREQYDQWLEKKLEIEEWFRTQITSKRLYKDFAPYLELPPSV